LGSVTDRLVREGTCPVLVTRVGGSAPTQLAHAMVMLDGSGLAEQAVPVALALANKPLGQVTLYRTVAEPGDRAPATTYLEGVAARFATAGVKADVMVDL